MRGTKRLALFVGLAFLLSGCILAVACADDDDYDGRKRGLGPVDNPTYKEQCGACHFAYQPALLPSGSWRKILSGLRDHHGEEIDVEAEDIEIIIKYLEDNAAEYSSAKRARKIMRSLDGQTPTRISQVPYILQKHDDLSEEDFKQEQIGSRSNCAACHTTAEQGDYDDDHVTIPK